MKRLLFSLLLFLSAFNVFSGGYTTIIDFTSTDSLECLPGTLYTEYFTMPVGTDYYVSQIGIKVGKTSAAGKFYFALYKGTGELLFRSNEFVYPGGVDSTLIVDVPIGVQDLTGLGNYYIACIGTANYLFKSQTSAVNVGVANLDPISQYKTSISYPNFPDPYTSLGNYGFNLNFVLNGVVKTVAIEPENEILEFNCTSRIDISNGVLYYSQIIMPAGDDKALRQIGIKTDSGTVSGGLKFAVYDNTNALLYVTDELSLNLSAADTSYVGIPAGVVTLSASQTYYIAIAWNGGSSLPVMKKRKPISRGLATIGDNSWYKTGFTYPNFPATISSTGSYAFGLGLVLNSDPLIPVTIENATDKLAIRLFPSVVDKTIGLYAEDVNEDVMVTVYSLLGTKMNQVNWDTTSSLELNVDGYPQGTYLVQISSPGVIKTLKFIKK